MHIGKVELTHMFEHHLAGDDQHLPEEVVDLRAEQVHHFRRILQRVIHLANVGCFALDHLLAHFFDSLVEKNDQSVQAIDDVAAVADILWAELTTNGLKALLLDGVDL